MAAAAAIPLTAAFSPAAAETRLARLGAGQKVERMRVTAGKSETVKLEVGFSDLVVGDPDIADVVPLTDHSMYILGKKTGTTNVTVYDAKKQLVGVIDVEVAHDARRVEEELRRRLPGAGIEVSTANGKLMLSGTARDAVSAERALTIARQFSPEVANGIAIGSSQQVMLEVRFVEAGRQAGRELGINWGIRSQNGFKYGNNNQFPSTSGMSWSPGNGAGVVGTGSLSSSSTPFGTIVGTLIGSGVNVDVMIQALEERQVARRLAEPNLVALSGDTASFLAGGQYPVPVPGTNGSPPTIQYKDYGVGLSFTPTVLDNSQINLKITPEVSELDYANAVNIAGVSVPALIQRRASTAVELRDGQSFAIAGLLQSRSETMLSQFPWLGSVPVLGALFRSTSFQRQETELVIIVTAHLVRPVAPGTALRTPLDDRKNGNDLDVFVAGRAEVSPAMIRYVEGGGATPALAGHIIDTEKGGARVR